MNAGMVVGAVLSMLVGAVTAACWLGLILAGMANASADYEARMWRFFWGVAAGGTVCTLGAVALLVARRPGMAAALGAVPLFAFLAFVILVVLS